MSDDSKRRPGRKPYRSRSMQPQPGDELGPYSLEHLAEMNERFVERLERAFASGAESPAAAAMNGANASRPR